ncbi:SIMPL domain-containing protein [Niallia oryzisoli]|uniref:SIMPL domain-containing protein n=1 Tax=Niallia oryzisoli TaxID=1737571 RepID=UPI003734E300
MHFPPRYQNYQPYTPYRNGYPFTMTIEGEGQLKVKPDQATISLGVVTENLNPQKAQEENAEITSSVILALKEAGIDENDIRTTSYSVNPRYDYIDGKSVLRGYEVEHQLEVTVKNLAAIGSIYDTAIKNGANRSGMIQFLVAQHDLFYREALNRAVQNSKEKAEEIAQSIGAVLNPMPIKITELRDQPITPFPAFSIGATAVTKHEAPPIQTGVHTIIARIKVVYAYNG